jgi:hypothetical protein
MVDADAEKTKNERSRGGGWHTIIVYAHNMGGCLLCFLARTLEPARAPALDPPEARQARPVMLTSRVMAAARMMWVCVCVGLGGWVGFKGAKRMEV